MNRMSAPDEIVIAKSGRRFGALEGETVLKAATRNGVNLPSACRNGTCGTCRARVVEGAFHFDEARAIGLTRADRRRGDIILTCCTRPEGRLVLDVEEVKGGRTGPPPRFPVRVVDLERPNGDVAILTLRLPPSERLSFKPGQFLGVVAPDGRVRHFSIARLSSGEIELHVGRVRGGVFSNHVLDALAVGSMLRVEGPFGQFTLSENDRAPTILLAGGTGFAPIKAMMAELVERRSERDIRLYWGSRSVGGLYGLDLLDDWARSLPRFRAVPIVSRDDPDWSGRRGRPHRAVIEDHPSLSGFEVYACGNPAMVDAAFHDFVAHGLDEQAFFADPFTVVPPNAASQTPRIP